MSPAFVEQVRRHGDRLAVVTADERLSYRQLAERVEDVAARLGGGRRLVMVETANDVAALVGYLAALHGGHVALLAPRSDRGQLAGLVERFDPDVVIGADGGVRARRAGSAHRLHPDLALLLTTSGSTGLPRLVRLSAAALDANAAAIATYLEITPDDRAALTLPLHYCYGLSVVNSNLLCGAAVLLSDASVLEPRFWTAFRAERGTSLHGVPHTFALLDRVGFAAMELPHLRYVTQAGGRLAPEDVRRWAGVGRRRGWQLFVMYGQTEATARMAYLPPDRAEARPEAVGVAIPGGSLVIEGAGPDGVGELVYRGPNVMLGYAEGPADLARGRATTALRTGDLGRVGADGLVEIVGRRARFVKPFGIRTDLDGLERRLAADGVEAACAGTDERIVVAARTTDAAAVRALLTTRLALPATVLSVVAVEELPRRPNGKLDHPAVLRLGTPPSRRTGLLRSLLPAGPRRRPATVRAVYAATFPGQDLTDDVTFVDLGGDSLTYVQVAADVERVLGQLPQGWEHIPLARLEAMVTPRPARGRSTIETGVLLRALAIVAVVGEHAHLWAVVGGAHLLFALAGWTFARFVLTAEGPAPHRSGQGGRRRILPWRILRSTARIAVPSAVWITFRALLHNVRFVDILLVGSLLPPLVAGYWFVDALVQILVLLALAFALPALRHLEQRHPFGFAASVLAVASLGRLDPTAYGWWFSTDIYSTQVVAWLFVLGWMAHRSSSTAQRWTTVAAILVLVPSFFGSDILRTVVVAGGLLLLQFLPRITVPRALATAATTVASASLVIYLTHFGILPLRTHGVPAALVVAISIAVGIVTARVLGAATRELKRRRRRYVPIGPGIPAPLRTPEPAAA